MVWNRRVVDSLWFAREVAQAAYGVAREGCIAVCSVAVAREARGGVEVTSGVRREGNKAINGVSRNNDEEMYGVAREGGEAVFGVAGKCGEPVWSAARKAGGSVCCGPGGW